MSAVTALTERSLMSDQVAAGLIVRMAIFYELLAGGDADRTGPEPLPTIGDPA